LIDIRRNLLWARKIGENNARAIKHIVKIVLPQPTLSRLNLLTISIKHTEALKESSKLTYHIKRHRKWNYEMRDEKEKLKLIKIKISFITKLMSKFDINTWPSFKVFSSKYLNRLSIYVGNMARRDTKEKVKKVYLLWGFEWCNVFNFI
jgi:hypothetical protein